MSVCLESNNVLANQVGTSTNADHAAPNDSTVTSTTPTTPTSADLPEQPQPSVKTITKLLVSNQGATVVTTGTQVIQKLTNAPVITVLNTAGGPLTVVKSLCVTSGITSTPQFTLVNSAPLAVSNAIGKAPTITLLNAPVTVLKSLTAAHQNNHQVNCTEKNAEISSSTVTPSIPAIIENRTHNVFIKNACPPDSTVPDIPPQAHKIIAPGNFSQASILANISSTIQPKTLPVTTQRSKLKILSNVAITPANTQNSTIAVSKPFTNNQPLRIFPPRSKVLGSNGTTVPAKYVNKTIAATTTINNVPKVNTNALKQHINEKTPQQRLMFPTHKSQIKTIPPLGNYGPKSQGIKTLSPQPKPSPGQVQRTGAGVRTIPPQRPPKLPNKLNYIGKHAVQAQKVRHGPRYKALKQSSMPYGPYHPPPPPMPDKQLTFNQALTAEILETLSNKSGPSYAPKTYETNPNRYETAYSYPEKMYGGEPMKPYEEKSKSGLDALSLICQAVLLDHNYNATLPPDSPPRPVPMAPQMNGMSSSMFSPGSNKRLGRPLPASNSVSSSSSYSSLPLIPTNNNSLMSLADDDAASDISDGSDRKHDTEGEETDTAPEAEAVTNEDLFDHYGDYVTRCICGFIHDDGYMVECDRCKVWQHVQCVVKNKQVPDEYLCELCDPLKPIDPQKARLVQQQWLRERQPMPNMKMKKEPPKIKEPFKKVMSDSDSSDAEQGPRLALPLPIKNRTTLANRRKNDNHKQTITRQKKDHKDALPRKPFKRRERKIVKRKKNLQTKIQIKNHTEEETHDPFSTTHLPQLRQWIEHYEEAVTNHYSPELRARISSIRVNGVHTDLTIQFDSSVNKCRVFTQPLTDIKYIVSTEKLPANTPIIELRGKYMLSTQHRNSGGSLNTRQHAQRPGPFLFFYRLHKDNTEVCVDTRTYGNSARFIRRSCTPNAELRHCIEKGVLHLYVVTITAVEKNVELTMKHESHDLAAIGTTHIACYCGNAELCTVNKTIVKKNGEPQVDGQRKRRGRRMSSLRTITTPEPVKIKEEPALSPTLEPSPPVPVKTELEIKVEKEEEVVVKEEPIEATVKIEEETEEESPAPIKEEKFVPDIKIKEEPEDEEEEEEVDCKSPPPISTRRVSHKTEKDDVKELLPVKSEKSKNKKLSREERKLEAILRAIEQMEKADQRKQEHKHTKQSHRRESEPAPTSKDDDKFGEGKQRRKRRKGRARTISTHSNRRDRLNSGDSYLTSGDENTSSPHDGRASRINISTDEDLSKDGLLMTVTSSQNCPIKREKTPPRDLDSNSNSAHSSPETPLSLACSLVQAAVEPLEPGFKFPKTKKVLMNEWLNKTPDAMTSNMNSPDFDSHNNYYSYKSLSSILPSTNQFCESSALQVKGNAKKRWLRQAIIEDKCDSPHPQTDSPPLNDSVAPPKKRRLPRESISDDSSPTRSHNTNIPPDSQMPQQEGCVEIVYSGADGDSPTQTLESDAVLKERAAEMKQEFSQCSLPSLSDIPLHRPDILPLSCLMDPRLTRDHQGFSNSEHLVGTVEKTLSILGFQDKRPETITPAKRKLSITEYRQRKKLNNNDHCDKLEEQSPLEEGLIDDYNSSESFKPSRTRSNSTSSNTSSDEELVLPELSSKAPAFNSEPTELERQREIANLRLKKVFGLSVDLEPRKPAIDVGAILECDQASPPSSRVITPMASPTSSDQVAHEPITYEKSPSPPPPPSVSPPPPPPPPDDPPFALDYIATSPLKPTENEEEKSAKGSVSEEDDSDLPKDQAEVEKAEEIFRPHMFYTPDEEEDESLKDFTSMDGLSYVPPFNNPVYPSTNYTSVIGLNTILEDKHFTREMQDEEGRYEGRNPSPPPNMDMTEEDIA